MKDKIATRKMINTACECGHPDWLHDPFVISAGCTGFETWGMGKDGISYPPCLCEQYQAAHRIGPIEEHT